VSTRTLVLGGGFGGIVAATELEALLGGTDHEVLLIDRKPDFSMGLRKLWELVGIDTIASGSRPRSQLADRGIDVIEEEILSIDPRARSVETSGGTYDGDHLVIALGAVSRPDLLPGLAEHGHDIWGRDGLPEAAAAVRAFDGGRLLVLIAGAPYPCPPGPYECVFHLDRMLAARGARDRTEISVVTLQPMLMPNAGWAGSEWMAAELAQRSIAQRVGAKAERVESARVVLGDGGEERFDLLLAVPPHRPPEVVAQSGLVGENGWVGVDAHTLATAHEGVFAIGDVNLIPLANGLPLPKAGVMAEQQGLRVARAIAASLRGGEPPPPFDGTGFCPVEVGEGAGALVQGNWYAQPEPEVEIVGPSEAYGNAKGEFERERLERWFGG
jgi:sulfide:quinone oxidoreductase